MMIPSAEITPQEEQVAVAADPMPTASTGPEVADVQIAEEAMPDDVLASANPEIAEPGTAQVNPDFDGLGAFIAEQVPETETSGATQKPTDLAAVDDVTQTAEGRAFGANNTVAHLVLKAKAPVWVRVEDAQGNVVMTQMLMKGDTYQVPDREGLVVIARDGGLLSYVIDGKEKGILGTPGEILVGRSLNLSSFEG